MCAGQGRDLVGALSGLPRRLDVRARLVELDERNVAVARQAISDSGLSGLEIAIGDASNSSSYAGAVPADLILACGMLGNIEFTKLPSLVSQFLHLSAPGAVVVWTYNSLDPERASTLRHWFGDAGFEEVAFEESTLGPEVVGVSRLHDQPRPFLTGVKMFEFVGYDNLGYELPDYTR
jgi:hypothetical protein